MQITIEIPEHMMSVFNEGRARLTARGFGAKYSTYWAAIYADQYLTSPGELSEAIIELFGVNLFHKREGVTHLIEKHAEWGELNRLVRLGEETTTALAASRAAYQVYLQEQVHQDILEIATV